MDKLATDSSFTFDYIHPTDSLNVKYLGRYQLIIQLDAMVKKEDRPNQ